MQRRAANKRRASSGAVDGQSGEGAGSVSWPELSSRDLRHLRQILGLLDAREHATTDGKPNPTRAAAKVYLRRNFPRFRAGGGDAWARLMKFDKVAMALDLRRTSGTDSVTRYLGLLRLGKVSRPIEVTEFLASLDESDLEAFRSRVRDGQSMAAFWQWFGQTSKADRSAKIRAFLQTQKETLESITELAPAPPELVAELHEDPRSPAVLRELLAKDSRASEELQRAVKKTKEDYQAQGVDFLALLVRHPFLESVYKVSWLHYSLGPSDGLVTTVRSVDDMDRLLEWVKGEPIFKRDFRNSPPAAGTVAKRISTYLRDERARIAEALAKQQAQEAQRARWRDIFPFLLERMAHAPRDGCPPSEKLGKLDEIMECLPLVGNAVRRIATKADPISTRVELARHALESIQHYEAAHPLLPPDEIFGQMKNCHEQLLAAEARLLICSLGIGGYLPKDFGELAPPRR